MSTKEFIDQIKELYEFNSYVTNERFCHMATAMCGVSEREARRMWRIYSNLVEYKWYKLQDESEEELNAVMAIARTAYKFVCEGAVVFHTDSEPQTPCWKIYYRMGEDGEIRQMEIDLRKKADVLEYAELLRRENIEILRRIDFYETIELGTGANSEKLKVYVGDIISCTDNRLYSLNNKEGVYICSAKGYKKLMYTPGRGYIRKGEPDYEQNEEGRDCLYSRWRICDGYDRFPRIVGNIYVDASVLKEEKKKSHD